MALPKLDLPRYEHELFGSNKKIKFRPFTVKEQKILLMAKEEINEENDNPNSIIEALGQIIELCTFGEAKIDEIPFFDAEDLFLRIRQKSVSDTATLAFKDPTATEVGKDTIRVTIPLSEAKVQVGDGHSKKIEITDSIGMVMRYPTLPEVYTLIDNEDSIDDMVMACIDYIYDGDSIYQAKETPKEELVEFINSFDTNTLLKVKKFLETMPRIRYDVKVKLSDGTERTKKLEGLKDFF